MNEQLTIWDFMAPEPEPKKGDCMTCQKRYWLHPKEGGAPILGSCVTCEYIPRRSCHTCESYGMTCDAYTCEPLGIKACFNYDAWSKNMNLKPDIGCEYWKEKK